MSFRLPLLFPLAAAVLLFDSSSRVEESPDAHASRPPSCVPDFSVQRVVMQDWDSAISVTGCYVTILSPTLSSMKFTLPKPCHVHAHKVKSYLYVKSFILRGPTPNPHSYICLQHLTALFLPCSCPFRLIGLTITPDCHTFPLQMVP